MINNFYVTLNVYFSTAKIDNLTEKSNNKLKINRKWRRFFIKSNFYTCNNMNFMENLCQKIFDRELNELKRII
jgi:hypothetical protein